jgi:hypothetical protein
LVVDLWALLAGLFAPYGRETTLRAFYLSAPWQIYETLYLLLRVQECRFITPSQGAGLIVLSVGDGILAHLSFRFSDPT